MQLNDLFSEIGQMLSPEESVQVLTALRQDPLVWQSLEQPEFLQAALEQAGSQVQCWSPGRLALLALNETRPVEALRAEPMLPLGPALQERALQTYQAAQRSGNSPASLKEAGLLALALRERRRLTGTWTGLLQELLPKQNAADSSTQASTALGVWRSSLACLYGLIPDPEEMLRSLLPKNPARIPFEWIAAAQLSQPCNEAEHVNAFMKILQGLPVAFQLNLLRSLSLRGSGRIAAALASRLLVGHPAFASVRAQSRPNELDTAGLSVRALALQQMGAFYQLSGERTQALALFSAAEMTLEQWLAGLYLQRLNLQIEQDAGDTIVLMGKDQLSHLASTAGWLKNELGVVLVSHPFASSLIDQVQDECDSAFLQLKRAVRMFESEPAVSQDLAREGAAGLLEEVRQRGIPFSGDFVYSWKPEDALQILIDLDLPEEALELTNALLEVRPVDLSLLSLVGLIHEQQGKLDEAIFDLRSIVALDPQNATWRRRLGNLWIKAGKYERAFVEWQTVLALSGIHSVSDYLACARVALQAGHLNQTVELCESVLQDDANNGNALGLLGQAFVARGEPQQAVSYLVRATRLSPETLTPWLVLASVQEDMGEPQQALETLRSAVTAVPEASEGHLALGKICVQGGMLAEALPHLKKAFQLSPQSEQAALLYGQTLRILGHANEAGSVFEKVRSSWTACPELAYEYAQVLLDLDHAENALPVLETALHNGLPVLNGYLLYAKILLGEYKTGEERWDAEIAGMRMEQAEQALQHILAVDPHNLEARFLVADILSGKGKLEEALAVYRDLADSPVSDVPELRWRIQWGLGRTALLLGQQDIALAALKEACQAKPDSLQLQRSLADACLQARLIQEALEAAEFALRLAPDDVHIISWYADFVTRAGEPRLAAEALERAVQLDPDRADLRVTLAISYLAAGNLQTAQECLGQVMKMEQASCGDLRRAGQVHLRMQDPRAALVCFERALAVNPPGPADLLFEVAQLHERMGNHEAALELVQQAQDDRPESLPVHLLQADLLARLNRPQAAVAVLERALRIAQNVQVPEGEILSPAFVRVLGEIHNRFTRLMVLSGDLPAALQHAESSFALNPNSAFLCSRAAELALAQLQNERAERIVQSFQPGEGVFPSVLIAQGKDGLDLLCLEIELALDAGLNAEAGKWTAAGLEEAPKEPRLLAASARLLAREGDLTRAVQVYLTARTASAGETGLWLVEAAMEVQKWIEAASAAERYARIHPNAARAQLTFARMLVLCAERQRLCESAGCLNNAPGPDVLTEGNSKKFEEALSAAGRLASAGEIGRWQARGQAAFMPSAIAVRTLAAMPSHPEDIAALIAVLRQLNNRTAAVQVARRFAENSLVMLQLALCYMGDAPSEGVLIAEKASKANPNEPLAFVIHAQLLREVNNLPAALDQYEKALALWPDEPTWHDAAADLCLEIGNDASCNEHRKQALDLAPQNARYAFKLGQAYLSEDNLSGAIECLEKSTALDLNQADVWLTLATAYHMASRQPQALEAAKKASELNEASAEGLLIAGEIALSMNLSDQALEYAQAAVRREPENAGVVLFYCNVLVMRGRFEEGLDMLEQASPEVKAVFPIAFERAKLIYRLHGPKAVLESLEKMANEYPEEPELLGFLARTQAECGDLKTAERYAFKALRLDPNQPDLTRMLGRLQRKAGQLDQAVHLLGEAIRMDPDDLESYLELGSVFQERREFVQALQVYREAMRIAPNDYQAFYQSGMILRDSKDYSGSETMLRRAAELAPDNLTIRRLLVAVIALNLVHHKQEVAVS